MAFLAIKDCEKELDLIERQIDERLPAAITRVNEARARQLLSSLKSTTDLERIGDSGDERGDAGAVQNLEDGGIGHTPARGNVVGIARHA